MEEDLKILEELIQKSKKDFRIGLRYKEEIQDKYMFTMCKRAKST